MALGPPLEHKVEGLMRNRMDRRGSEERGLQREVLALVLVEHPVRTTVRDLQKELGRPTEVEGAVAALVDEGLLAREGDDVVPTPAAIRFHEIEPIDPPGRP
jgi:hypothetical protein